MKALHESSLVMLILSALVVAAFFVVAIMGGVHAGVPL